MTAKDTEAGAPTGVHAGAEATEVLLGGFGGQGIILSGLIMGKAAALFTDKRAAFTQSYGPEARGGSCSANVIISDEDIDYPYVESPHFMMVMSQGAYEKYFPMLRPGGILMIEEDLVELTHPREDVAVFSIPATRLSEQLGRKIVANIVMLGFVTAVSQVVSYEAMKQAILDTVPKGTEELNMKAYNMGYDFGKLQLEERRAKSSR
jgi:2-oxoglutarate ferredoxin oxidoreductase subunit gamma